MILELPSRYLADCHKKNCRIGVLDNHKTESNRFRILCRVNLFCFQLFVLWQKKFFGASYPKFGHTRFELNSLGLEISKFPAFSLCITIKPPKTDFELFSAKTSIFQRTLKAAIGQKLTFWYCYVIIRQSRTFLNLRNPADIVEIGEKS